MIEFRRGVNPNSAHACPTFTSASLLGNERQILGVEKVDSDGVTWEKINAIMDSGAFDSICGREHVKHSGKVRETAASKSGVEYWAANGGKIKNLGEGDVSGMSEDGLSVEMTAQVCDNVRKMLIAWGGREWGFS